jgi:sortase A
MADGNRQLGGSNSKPHNEEAIDLIRQKVAGIYGEEPDAKSEAIEAESTDFPSKHQKFMQELVNSGKSVVAIQTEWHRYYLSLPDKEKLKVWDEFYKSNKNTQKAKVITPDQPKEMGEVKNQVLASTHYRPRKQPTHRTHTAQMQQPKVKLQAKHHIQSLLFGLGVGLLAVFIFLFGFFNEVVIAPFIQPSRNVSVPVIVGENTVAPTSTPEVIIPKINVEIPVDYNVDTTNENVIENDLEGGVIHFPTTVDPGQLGNAAFFGHSSNNIFNPGQYKFAFVLLHTIVDGDTFYLTYNHTVYVYKVISHFIVSPSDVAVLGAVPDQQATATLITCDPPGTSINRLIVIGQQISPSVSTDVQGATAISPIQSANSLPGNGPSLWSRFISSAAGKLTVIVIAALAIILVFRRVSKREPF